MRWRKERFDSIVVKLGHGTFSGAAGPHGCICAEQRGVAATAQGSRRSCSDYSDFRTTIHRVNQLAIFYPYRGKEIYREETIYQHEETIYEYESILCTRLSFHVSVASLYSSMQHEYRQKTASLHKDFVGFVTSTKAHKTSLWSKSSLANGTRHCQS